MWRRRRFPAGEMRREAVDRKTTEEVDGLCNVVCIAAVVVVVVVVAADGDVACYCDIDDVAAVVDVVAAVVLFLKFQNQSM